MPTTYEPTWESVKQHPVPEWFNDAKLGVLVVWGLFSVPGYAPLTGDFNKVVREQGWEAFFRLNPYAEWYYNTMKFPDNPTRRYHESTYGAGFPYDGFAPIFHEAVEAWDPAPWVDLWQRAGVRYSVFLTKHHDGFLLWPSRHANPHKPGWQVRRDVAGELAEATRRAGMRFGVYYSGGLDWSFKDDHIRDEVAVFRATPQEPGYVAYCDTHWQELIERYDPAVLWSDISHPAASNLPALFANYYNRLPDGVVNDRFAQVVLAENRTDMEVMGPPPSPHFDFRTPEYSAFDRLMDEKWESNRGLAHSYSYNRNEGPENYLSVPELVRMLVDVVSKNGNLLLSFGPMADGTVPDLQRERLEGLGAWLSVNGEAIYGTRPWHVAEGKTRDGIAVRYTQKDTSLYATLWNLPAASEVIVQGLHSAGQETVHLLGHAGPLPCRQESDGLAISLPSDWSEAPAYAFKIAPMPQIG